MEETAARVWEQLVGRGHGQMTFRLYVQPMVATFFAIRSGLRDARDAQPLYFWTMIFNATRRRELILHGWKDVGTLFIVAIALDVTHQLIAFQWVYPIQLLIVAVLLAIVPYLIMRGLTHRIARRLRR